MGRYNDLIEKYNYMFELMKDRRYPISFGFECDVGWFKIISELIEEIGKIDTKHEVRIFQIKEKLGSLRFYIEEYPKPNKFDEIMLFISNYYNNFIKFLTQKFRSKYKFFKLYRYYTPMKKRKILKLIRIAEKKSCNTCEICGNTYMAEIRSINKWLQCLCHDCVHPVKLSFWQKFKNEIPTEGRKIEVRDPEGRMGNRVMIFYNENKSLIERYEWRYVF